MSEQIDKTGKILRYQKGEQVITQGDYSISIYKILRGKVQIFRAFKGVEISLETLGPGELIGEMAFLSGERQFHSASARALEETDLEVRHPSEFADEYEKAPPVIKTIAAQAINRLKRMNKFMDKLAVPTRVEPSKEPQQDDDSGKEKRRYYRKKVDISCKYAPSPISKDFPPLKGEIKDISMTGLCLEVPTKNGSKISHAVGKAFHIDTVLPNDKELNVTAEIISVNKTGAKLRLGLEFKNLADYQRAKKNLGFFMMPA